MGDRGRCAGGRCRVLAGRLCRVAASGGNRCWIGKCRCYAVTTTDDVELGYEIETEGGPRSWLLPMIESAHSTMLPPAEAERREAPASGAWYESRLPTRSAGGAVPPARRHARGPH